MADVTVDLSKGVQEARVKPGDTLTVCLEESPTTGFMWALQDSLPPEMNYVRDEFTPAQSGLGGAGRRCFIYVCRGEFTGELGYALRRPWIPDEIANELRVRITCTAS